MPFVIWGADPHQQIVADEGGCSPDIKGDTYGNPYTFFGNGPPGCVAGRDPQFALEREFGGQLLGFSENGVTMKIHRAVTRPGSYSFYNIWDSTNPVMAAYYGVPVSTKLLLASEGTSEMKVFGNGIPCEFCGAYGFQDDIFARTYSSIRTVFGLLWNCNNLLASGDLFAAQNHGQDACQGSDPNCDPYPLRASLKFVECAAYATANGGILYDSDEDPLLASGVLFETLTPLGASPEWIPEVRNTPVVIIYDESPPAPLPGDFTFPEGATNHVLWATDSNQRWLYTATQSLEVPEGASWTALTPSSSSDVQSGAAATIAVNVGDVVTFGVNSGVVPHGLALSDTSFFTAAYPGATIFSEDDFFTDLYGTAGQVTAPIYNGQLFVGVVNDAAFGTQVYVSDPVWGPFWMNVILQVAPTGTSGVVVGGQAL